MLMADAMAHFRNVKALANALGKTESLVYGWQKHEFVPEKHAIQVHLKSGQAVPIRPEDYARE